MQTTIQALNLVIPQQVFVRKLPSAQETLDTLPLIIVCPNDFGERITYLGFEGNILVDYPVDIVVISTGNRDFSQANLETYMDWQRQIRDKYQQVPVLNATPYLTQYCIGIECLPDAILNRRLINQSYDYIELVIHFKVIENAFSQ